MLVKGDDMNIGPIVIVVSFQGGGAPFADQAGVIVTEGDEPDASERSGRGWAYVWPWHLRRGAAGWRTVQSQRALFVALLGAGPGIYGWTPSHRRRVRRARARRLVTTIEASYGGEVDEGAEEREL